MMDNSPDHSVLHGADTLRHEPTLTHAPSAGAVSMSPELFEKVWIDLTFQKSRILSQDKYTALFNSQGCSRWGQHQAVRQPYAPGIHWVSFQKKGGGFYSCLPNNIWSSFVISAMTFSMVLMGWGGASGLTPVV